MRTTHRATAQLRTASQPVPFSVSIHNAGHVAAAILPAPPCPSHCPHALLSDATAACTPASQASAWSELTWRLASAAAPSLLNSSSLLRPPSSRQRCNTGGGRGRGGGALGRWRVWGGGRGGIGGRQVGMVQCCCLSAATATTPTCPHQPALVPVQPHLPPLSHPPHLHQEGPQLKEVIQQAGPAGGELCENGAASQQWLGAPGSQAEPACEAEKRQHSKHTVEHSTRSAVHSLQMPPPPPHL